MQDPELHESIKRGLEDSANNRVISDDEMHALLEALERPAREVPRLTKLMQEDEPWSD